MGKEKLRILIAGILAEFPCLPKVKLAKLVLFSEMEFFRRHHESFTGLYFVRLKMGPVIAFFDDVLKKNEGVFWERSTESLGIFENGKEWKQYSYSLLKDKSGEIQPSKNLQESIKCAVSSYGHKTGSELSDLSHKIPAWKYSEPDEPIYIAELTAGEEKEYFALIDLVEGFDEVDDEFLPEKIRECLP